MTKPKTFHECCTAVVKAAKNAPPLIGTSRLLDYAASYAQVGLRLKEGSQDAKIQALYIVENLKAWREPEAKEIRMRLRELAK